jgi:tetratricopeptide (TPR) repeat protein
MTNRILIPVFLLVFGITSCSQPQRDLQESISSLENELRIDTATTIDRPKSEELIRQYLEYVAEFPDDTASPAYLFRAAELCVAMGRYTDAMLHFGQVMRYKNSPKAADALFLQGFVQETYLQNPDSARIIYERFVTQHPEHPLADDARVLIDQLGIPPEELIRMFEQKAESHAATESQ